MPRGSSTAGASESRWSWAGVVRSADRHDELKRGRRRSGHGAGSAGDGGFADGAGGVARALAVLGYLVPCRSGALRGETSPDLAAGFGIGTTTAFRYVREAIDVLAAQAPTLAEAVAVALRKAFVILDGTLLRIDRVAMASGRDRSYYSGKWKCHGMNVQVISDPAGRLVWASPALPGARHDTSSSLADAKWKEFIVALLLLVEGGTEPVSLSHSAARVGNAQSCEQVRQAPSGMQGSRRAES